MKLRRVLGGRFLTAAHRFREASAIRLRPWVLGSNRAENRYKARRGHSGHFVR